MGQSSSSFAASSNRSLLLHRTAAGADEDASNKKVEINTPCTFCRETHGNCCPNLFYLESNLRGSYFDEPQFRVLFSKEEAKSFFLHGTVKGAFRFMILKSEIAKVVHFYANNRRVHWGRNRPNIDVHRNEYEIKDNGDHIKCSCHLFHERHRDKPLFDSYTGYPAAPKKSVEVRVKRTDTFTFRRVDVDRNEVLITERQTQSS